MPHTQRDGLKKAKLCMLAMGLIRT
jgi:hypothetical protein